MCVHIRHPIECRASEVDLDHKSFEFSRTVLRVRGEVPLAVSLYYACGNAVLQSLNWIWYVHLVVFSLRVADVDQVVRNPEGVQEEDVRIRIEIRGPGFASQSRVISLASLICLIHCVTQMHHDVDLECCIFAPWHRFPRNKKRNWRCDWRDDASPLNRTAVKSMGGG